MTKTVKDVPEQNVNHVLVLDTLSAAGVPSRRFLCVCWGGGAKGEPWVAYKIHLRPVGPLRSFHAGVLGRWSDPLGGHTKGVCLEGRRLDDRTAFPVNKWARSSRLSFSLATVPHRAECFSRNDTRRSLAFRAASSSPFGAVPQQTPTTRSGSCRRFFSAFGSPAPWSSPESLRLEYYRAPRFYTVAYWGEMLLVHVPAEPPLSSPHIDFQY